MATNEVYLPGWYQSLVVSNPTTPASGGPVRVGALTGVALTDKGKGGNPSTQTSVYLGPGVFNLSVKGANEAGNVAIALGDPIFYVDADTPKLSAKTTGYFFGYAMAAVNSGATSTIAVMHVTPAQAGAQNLSSTLRTGTIALLIETARLIATNDIPNTAASPSGGLLTLNTAPLFKRVNGATDKTLIIQWAASSSVEIAFPPAVLPADFDNTQAITFNARVKMGGATDTPTFTVDAFAESGANLGGASSAASNAIATITRSITATTLSPGMGLSISLTPGAHTTDALNLYSAWLSFGKK